MQLHELASVLEVDLGLVAGWLLSTSGTAFYYVCRKTRSILGCIIAESIHEAWEATYSGADKVEDESEEKKRKKKKRRQRGDGGGGGGVVLVDKEAVKKIRHGIRMMWTAASARRQKIASKLLDCVRSQSVRGCVLAKSEVAFSQPTTAGAAFIHAYSGSKTFCVYDANGM